MALPPENPKPSPASQRDAAQQEGFIREVDEALREQQFMDILRNYGRPIGIAVAAGLLGLGGYLTWDHYTKQAAAERSEKFILALDRMGTNGLAAGAVSRELEPLTKEGSAGEKAAAAMMLAVMAQQQGKSDEAAKGFAAIAADSAAPQVFRDLATIREVSIKFDSMQPQQVVDRLKALAVPGNPWFGSAAELTGMAWLKAGQPAKAGPLFSAAAKDKNVPESLRKRMMLMAGQLGADPGEIPTPGATQGAQ